MNGLIRWIAGITARWIERGSVAAALLGAVIGGIAAAGVMAAGYQATSEEGCKQYSVAAILVAAIAGALVGSRVRLGQRGDEIIPAQWYEPVRLTNINAHLGPLVLVSVCLAIFGGLGTMAVIRDGFDNSMFFVGAIVLGLALIAWRLIARLVWAVTIGEDVYLHQLGWRRRFERSAVKQWGFEVARGKLDQVAPVVPSLFVIELAGNWSFEAPATPEQAGRVARWLTTGRGGSETRTLSEVGGERGFH